MDPLSITVACTGLISSIGQLSMQICSFVSRVREAHRDLDAVLKELSSLGLCLETLKNDAMVNSRRVPQPLEHRVLLVLVNTAEVVKDMREMLTTLSSDKFGNKMRWAFYGQDDMNKLRSRLESHKASLEIALALLSLSLNTAIKDDTSSIRRNVKDTAIGLDQIAAVLAALPDRIAAHLQTGALKPTPMRLVPLPPSEPPVIESARTLENLFAQQEAEEENIATPSILSPVSGNSAALDAATQQVQVVESEAEDPEPEESRPGILTSLAGCVSRPYPLNSLQPRPFHARKEDAADSGSKGLDHIAGTPQGYRPRLPGSWEPMGEAESSRPEAASADEGQDVLKKNHDNGPALSISKADGTSGLFPNISPWKPDQTKAAISEPVQRDSITESTSTPETDSLAGPMAQSRSESENKEADVLKDMFPRRQNPFYDKVFAAQPIQDSRRDNSLTMAKKMYAAQQTRPSIATWNDFDKEEPRKDRPKTSPSAEDELTAMILAAERDYASRRIHDWGATG